MADDPQHGYLAGAPPPRLEPEELDRSVRPLGSRRLPGFLDPQAGPEATPFQGALEGTPEVEVAPALGHRPVGWPDRDVHPRRLRPRPEDGTQLAGAAVVRVPLQDQLAEARSPLGTRDRVVQPAVQLCDQRILVVPRRQQAIEELGRPCHVVGDDQRPGGEGVEDARVDGTVRLGRAGGVIEHDLRVRVDARQVVVCGEAVDDGLHLRHVAPAPPVDADGAARREQPGHDAFHASGLAPPIGRRDEVVGRRDGWRGG